ncbi:tRNA1(Val) (adenine(37)-N6)-methyltransferase [Blastochloris viridis]|uniref:tRNA1(Val) (Adenine(37)-N6)-methyltransferase n=1 Tax=Blastochloris viridis TaxID=1079 RepID=A0A0S4Q3F5_BLAVI|nr:tRNA1(Val) (adenine(37)-N6)-methyltransferase [Blastochloris viridis]
MAAAAVAAPGVDGGDHLHPSADRDQTVMTDATTDDAVLGGRLRLLQPARGHRVGHDAILLAAAVPALPGERAVDLGAGVGAAGLAVAARVPGLSMVLVEIDPGLAALAGENAARNGLAGRVTVVAADVATVGRADGPPAAGAFDQVLCNPPFLDPSRHAASPDAGKRGAHMPDRPRCHWIAAAGRLLQPGGTLTLIDRADALAGVLADLGDRWGAVEVVPVHPRPDAPASRVLVRARKGRRTPLSLRPPLVLAEPDGRPSTAAEAALRRGDALAV